MARLEVGVQCLGQQKRGAASVSRAPQRAIDVKILPISNVQRSSIIHHLALHGKWRGTRRGARLRIVRFPTASGERVIYSVRIGGETISAPAATVFEAVAELNDLVLAVPIRGVAHNRSLVGRESDTAAVAASGD